METPEEIDAWDIACTAAGVDGDDDLHGDNPEEGTDDEALEPMGWSSGDKLRHAVVKVDGARGTLMERFYHPATDAFVYSCEFEDGETSHRLEDKVEDLLVTSKSKRRRGGRQRRR